MAGRRRYPGVKYFTKADNDIFCGREKEIAQLFTQIMFSRIVVLHADSGSGKSSLVRAGLLPEVDRHNLEVDSGRSRELKILPVIIKGIPRQNNIRRKVFKSPDEKDFIKAMIIRNIKNEIKKHFDNLPSLPIIENNEDELWYLTKQLQTAGYELLLVFDQFEELQTYSYEQILDFKQQLAKLFRDSMPTTYDDQINDFVDKLDEKPDYKQIDKEITLLEKRLQTKALFVVREDKLGTMSLLNDYFPDILRNDFLLKGLDHDGAIKAITKPATRPKGDFETDPFEITEAAAEHIISQLKDEHTALLDPLQIQIVCERIEHKISRVRSKITKEDLPKDIKKFIKDFYKDVWKEVQKKFSISDIDFITIKKRIIEKLVVNEKRVPVIEDRFLENDDKAIVDLLEEKGILRKSDEYYELSHDRLIKPLSEDLKALKFKEEEITRDKKIKKRLKIGVLVSTSIIVILIVWLGAVTAEQGRILGIAKITRLDNPTFAYTLVKDYDESNIITSRLKSYIENLDTINSSYITSVIPVASHIVDVSLNSTTGIINIVESAYTIKRQYSSAFVTSKDVNTEELIKIKETAIGQLKVFRSGEGLTVRDKDNIPISKFGDFENSLSDEGLTNNYEDNTPELIYRVDLDGISENNIDISADGRYLLAGDVLFALQTGEIIDTLPPYENVASHGQMASAFLNESNRLAVGYWTGWTVIFEIDTSKAEGERINMAKVFAPVNGQNSVVNAMAIDSKDNYLITGDREGDIAVWEIGNDLNPDDPSIVEKPLRLLQGHLDAVNCLNLSPNDSLLLSGSADRNAILWNIHSGEKYSFLRGMQSAVKFVAFSDNENEFFTVTDKNQLYVWKKDQGRNLYNENRRELIQFSPLNYYIAGLEDGDWRKRYDKDNKDVKKLYANIAGYLLSFPNKNYYPGDGDYLKVLENSINEMTAMYNSLQKHPEYEKKLNQASKDALEEQFIDFEYSIKPALLLESEEEDSEAAFNRLTDYVKKRSVMLVQDSSDVHTANKLLVMTANQVVKYSDSLDRHFKKVEISLGLIDAILKASPSEWKRNSTFAENRKDIAILCNNISYRALLEKDSHLAVSFAERALKINPEEKSTYSNLALVYLLDKQWGKAKEIYTKKESFPAGLNPERERLYLDLILDYINKGQIEKAREIHIISKEEKENIPADKIFLYDLEVFEKAGIISGEDAQKARNWIEN